MKQMKTNEPRLRPSPLRMNIKASLLALITALVVVSAPAVTGARQSSRQTKRSASAPPAASSSTPAAPTLLTRSTTRHEVRRFGYGGTLTLYGAPEGRIRIEAWPRSEVEVTADIELRAPTEEDLAMLALVNNFVLDDDANHLTLMTTGTHDRKFMKKTARDFPKRLLTMPWKIDYRVRVPASIDLEIYVGRGAFHLAGVEGAIRLDGGESDVTIEQVGGSFEATLQRGSVNFRATGRSWRGRGVNVRLASGDINVELPASFNADLDATLLRAGRIENTHAALSARERTQQTENAQHLRAGAGGAMLSFTLGDGTIRLRPEKEKSRQP